MNCFVSLEKKIPIREQRMMYIKANSNTINLSNEGKKHDSYQRFLLKKQNTNICKGGYIVPLFPKKDVVVGDYMI